MTRQDGPILPTAFPRNPAYGNGIFRRRIRLMRQDHRVLALLDDTNHAMWARIHHDGARILAVEGRTVRVPNSNCPGAAAALDEFIGLPLAMPRSELFAEGRPFRNCTHLFDCAALAMEQALREEPARTYDIIIPDEVDRPVMAEVLCNSEPIIRWPVSHGKVVAFAPEPPVPIMRGFTAWATGHLSGEQLDAALILQRAYLVSGARMWIVDRSPDLPITAMPELLGACFAYQPSRVDDGVQAVGNVIDLTGGFTDENLQPIPDG